jgi:acetyltransferase-like isoleucine patch superfamily enzyme
MQLCSNTLSRHTSGRQKIQDTGNQMGIHDKNRRPIIARVTNNLKRIFNPILKTFYYQWLSLFRIYVDPSARISILANLENDGCGEITIGSETEVLRQANILTYGGRISIGNHCSINPYVIIYGHGGVTIGNYVQIATQVTIIPANHIFSNLDIPIANQGVAKIGIVIEDNVWIASGARILDGVTIRKGCIIGANAVVTKSTEENGIYVGCPARLLRMR